MQFVFIIICAFFAQGLGDSEIVKLQFEPSGVQKVLTGELALVCANATSNATTAVSLDVSSSDTDLLEVVNSTTALLFTLQRGAIEQVCFVIRGKFLGHAVLIYNLSLQFDENASKRTKIQLVSYPVTILRTKKGRVLSQAFLYVMIALVVINTFFMGSQLDLQIILNCIKRPIGPVIGFCCQFGLMPLIAFGWGSVFLRAYPILQLGFFAVGCSPGGGMSNFWAILLDGNLDLSVTMTFISSVAAMFMMPFWIYTLGQALPTSQVNIPFLDMLRTFASMLIPIGIGIAFRYWKPEWAKKCRLAIKIFTLVIVIVATVFGTYANLFIFQLITWYTVVCGMLLPWTGYTLGYLVTVILRQTAKDRLTIAIETGIQNAGIGILLLKFSLQEPDSDLSLVMPVCVMLFSGAPLWIALLLKTIKNRFFDPPDKTADSKGQIKDVEKPSDRKIHMELQKQENKPAENGGTPV